MDVDEYLSGLQSELDNQLSSLGLDGQQSASSQSSQDVDEQKEFQFCPECGSRVEADVNFCPNCGSRLGENEDAEDGDEASDVNCAENVGIIFTDTGILASKYGVSIEDVDEMLSSFMHTCEQYDQDWRLLDMHYHQDELGEATWMDYSDVLQQYIKDNDIKPGSNLSLSHHRLTAARAADKENVVTAGASHLKGAFHIVLSLHTINKIDKWEYG